MAAELADGHAGGMKAAPTSQRQISAEICGCLIPKIVPIALAPVQCKVHDRDMVDIGVATGVIGAVTGVIALVVSIKSYNRVRDIKALDMRLEISKTFDNLDVILSGINGYLDFVHKSHLRVLAATGRRLSGERESFDEEFKRDKAQLLNLLGTQPRREQDYTGYSPNELELIITRVHGFSVQISEIRDKYQKIFESDEGMRTEIRHRHES